MTHYTAVTIALAWCVGRRATRREYDFDARSLWVGCSSVANRACDPVSDDTVHVGSREAHIDGIRASCPKCEVLWDEAVGA